MRANALTVIHKYLRREMFDFAQQLFRAGPEDCASVVRALKSLVETLQQHARQEEVRFEPLLRELDPTLAERLHEDHRRLEQDLEAIVELANRLEPSAPGCRESLTRLHLDWNRYLSRYLAHLDDEERTLFFALEDRIPPVGMLANIAKEGGAQGGDLLLKIWAVTTCEERLAIERATETLARSNAA